MGKGKKKNASRQHNTLASGTQLRYKHPVDFTEIKRRRLQLGLSQGQAAKLAGWKNPQIWRNMEGGQRQNPQVSTLLKIADVLKCKMDDLVNR